MADPMGNDSHLLLHRALAGDESALAEVRELRDRSAPGRSRRSSNERSFRLLSARKDGQAARSLTRVGTKSGR